MASREPLGDVDSPQRDEAHPCDEAKRVPFASDLRAVKNRERKCLRATRDVAGDEDRGAEFAEGATEGQESPRDDPAPSERKRDPPKHADRAIPERPCDA